MTDKEYRKYLLEEFSKSGPNEDEVVKILRLSFLQIIKYLIKQIEDLENKLHSINFN